ncbi:MAG: T9SS type A sorting domain-containing protein [Crocinitomicaceae bacterium]|nr:T9SS type A sorting domain-containing protein [Crocinitomicaceae bacterium]
MIAIPDPCNEDFSKMNKTERGAFCSKCSTDTFDFRKLSNPEILRLIAKNKGEKMCGQFTSRQLYELNLGFEEWRKQTPRTFRSKFIFAVLIGFGLTLFSCTQERDLVEQELSAIEEIVEVIPKINYINQETSVSELDLTNYVDSMHLPPIPEFEVNGGLELYELGGDMIIEEVYEHPRDWVTGGIPAISHEFIEYAEIITVEMKDTIEETILPEPIQAIEFTSKVYPNPSKGLSTLEIEIKEADEFQIDIYNANGSFVQNIYSGELNEGRQRFEIDLSYANSGMYLVRLSSSSQSETLKLQRVN